MANRPRLPIAASVALLLMNGSAFFECYFACAKIGAVHSVGVAGCWPGGA